MGALVEFYIPRKHKIIPRRPFPRPEGKLLYFPPLVMNVRS